MHLWIRTLRLCLLLSVVSGALAQTPLTLRGSVRDRTAATVAGVAVSLEDGANNTVAKTVSDARGDFALINLPPGDYHLVIPAQAGFAARSIPVSLSAPIAGFKVVLQPASVTAEITVTSDPPALSTDASSNRDTVAVSADEMRKVPVFDQDIIATMIPFLDAGSGSSGGVTIIVDGVEMKSAGVSASAIQEVRINNDPYSAEFTRPGRGRIEIITKPGSPQFHGEANFIFRDAIFNARNYFALVRPPESRRIYEGHLSGPFGTGGRTSFIASGSRRERDTAVVVNALTAAGPDIENVLTPRRDSQYSIRVTHDFSPNHRLSLGYNYEEGTQTNAGVGGLVLPEAGYNTDSREDDLILNDRLILSPNLINQLVITFEKDEDVTKSVTNKQSIQVDGAYTGGGAQADVARTENTIHINDVVTWSHGRHYLRAGVQLPQFSRRAVDDHTNTLGTAQFNSLADFNSQQVNVYTQNQGRGRGLYWINEFGSFIQDQIKFSPKLQATFGLRYDWQTFLPDNNNFAPRVSLAYAPGKSPNGGKTILRVGTGVFYDRTGGDTPAISVLHDGVILRTARLERLTGTPSTIADLSPYPTSLIRFNPHVRAPYALQYSFGIERQIHKTITLTAGYRGQVQIKSFRSRDANAPLPNAGYIRPNPSLAQVQNIESGGRNMLNALDVSFRGQAGRWFSGQAQYTLAKFMSNTSGIKFFPQDQYNPNNEWGRADQDQRHRLLVLGTIYPDHWLSLGVGVTVFSRAPYTETSGVDLYRTGLGNARPAGVARNTLEGGGTTGLDLVWDHDFRLSKAKGDNAKVFSASLSGFNVVNHTNYGNYIGNVTSSRFRQPTTAFPARQLQLSLGYRF